MLAEQADRLVGGPGAYLVIDDTALPKQGTLSMAVARQYCGKRANCQALVSLTLAQGEVPVLVSLRLFLPDEWIADAQRCTRAGVPAERPWRRMIRQQVTKGKLAVRFAAVRVRVADGAIWANNRHLPGDEVWFVGNGAHRASAGTT